jgi:RNA polymerase sporulation-specific sigma factor
MFFETIAFLLGKIRFFCGAITSGSSFPKPLSKEEEKVYIERARAGDKKSKDALITHNMRLVAHIVKKYSGSAETDDLISVGSIGLIKAINNFSPEKGNSLATFASRCIENEILMLLRANKKHKNNVSLYDTIGQDKDGNELNVIDLLSEQEDSVLMKVENRLLKEKFLAVMKDCLSPREYKIICLRYGLKGGRPLAQREVASLLKISRSYISRIEKKAVERLKIEVKNRDFFLE